jgi:hypothetical protein
MLGAVIFMANISGGDSHLGPPSAPAVNRSRPERTKIPVIPYSTYWESADTGDYFPLAQRRVNLEKYELDVELERARLALEKQKLQMALEHRKLDQWAIEKLDQMGDRPGVVDALRVQLRLPPRAPDRKVSLAPTPALGQTQNKRRYDVYGINCFIKSLFHCGGFHGYLNQFATNRQIVTHIEHMTDNYMVVFVYGTDEHACPGVRRLSPRVRGDGVLWLVRYIGLPTRSY